MRQFIANGPEIPSEVLHALEEDKLVFFCGAGISVYTELPDFKQLVIDAFRDCSVPLEIDRTKAREPHDLAFSRWQYDKALDLLERKTALHVMRRAIVARLSVPLPGRLAGVPHIHKALLDLSRRSTGGHRLVTTNFDDRFTLADPKISDINDAPRLAPPRRDSWWHPTFLHGRINGGDPNGQHLILTSADFGRAYLRDGWAARFIVELFREFTVLFIGYSVNDPVMAYLIDALAADTGHDRQFKRAFAFDGFSHDEAKREAKVAEWAAKNIELIPINTGHDPQNPNFQPLDDTLTAWARYHTGGLGTRIAETLKNTLRPYVAADEQEARNVAWALSEPRGSIARAFADNAPPPHISWFAPLSKIQLPSSNPAYVPLELFRHPSPLAQQDGRLVPHLAPLGGFESRPVALRLSPVGYHLARWLVRNLNEDDLVKWLVGSGGIVHPTFALLIERQISADACLHEPVRALWKLVVDGVLRPQSGESSRYLLELAEAKKTSDDKRSIHFLVATATAHLTVAHPLGTWRRRRKGSPQLSDIVRLELSLQGAYTLKNFRETLFDTPADQALLIQAADDLTSKLLFALRLADRAQLYAVTTESHWTLPSIPEHSQNEHRPEWIVLVELCRDAFDLARKKKKQFAYTLLVRWVSLWHLTGFSIFVRLALYGYANWSAADTLPALRLLIARNGVLWKHFAHREVMFLLRQRSKDFSKEQLSMLVKFIRKGPPRSQYKKSVSEQDFRRLVRDSVSIRLAKLMQGGARIGGVATKLAREHMTKFEKEPGDRDEFLIWSGSAHWVPEENADDLVDKTADDIAVKLSKLRDDWDAGRKFQDLAKRDRILVFDVMRQLLVIGERRNGIWNGAFHGLEHEGEIAPLQEIANKVSDITAECPEVVSLALFGLSSWLLKLSEHSEADLESRTDFWVLWSRAWNAAVAVAAGETAFDVDAALNNPGGKLAEALVARLWKRARPPGAKIPNELVEHFNNVAVGVSATHRLGRIILGSRLFWLHVLDPEWSRNHVISKMAFREGSSNNDAEDCRALWEGYLWTPRLGPSLLLDLKTALLIALHKANQLKDFSARQLYRLFAIALVEQPDAFAANEINTGLAALAPVGLRECADLIGEKLESAEEKAGALWHATVKPILQNSWPATLDKITPEVGAALSRLLIQTGDAFPDALNTLLEKGLLRQDIDQNRILHKLAERKNGGSLFHIVERFPRDVLNFLAGTISLEATLWSPEDLSQILRRILELEPPISDTPNYRRLDALLRRG